MSSIPFPEEPLTKEEALRAFAMWDKSLDEPEVESVADRRKRIIKIWKRLKVMHETYPDLVRHRPAGMPRAAFYDAKQVKKLFRSEAQKVSKLK